MNDGRSSCSSINSLLLWCFKSQWASHRLLAFLSRWWSINYFLAFKQDFIWSTILSLWDSASSSSVIGSKTRWLLASTTTWTTVVMMWIILMHLRHHLVLVHLACIKHSMTASLTTTLRALIVVLQTCWGLSWNDTSLAAMHLYLSWQSDCSSPRCCTWIILALSLIELNST